MLAPQQRFGSADRGEQSAIAIETHPTRLLKIGTVDSGLHPLFPNSFFKTSISRPNSLRPCWPDDRTATRDTVTLRPFRLSGRVANRVPFSREAAQTHGCMGGVLRFAHRMRPSLSRRNATFGLWHRGATYPASPPTTDHPATSLGPWWQIATRSSAIFFPKKKIQIVAADPPYRPRMFNLKYAPLVWPGAGWGRQKDRLNELGRHQPHARRSQSDRSSLVFHFFDAWNTHCDADWIDVRTRYAAAHCRNQFSGCRSAREPGGSDWTIGCQFRLGAALPERLNCSAQRCG